MRILSLVVYDLFISYSSADRPWAEKLCQDLRVAFPAISVFWDRAAIPAGQPWRTFLTNANVSATHLAIFWSDSANQSNEVRSEIALFVANQLKLTSQEKSQRRAFYVPLEGGSGGPIQDNQGFPDFKAYYDKGAPDRGISKLAAGQGRTEWERMIRMIGDAIRSSDPRHGVIAAIVATSTPRLSMLDALSGVKQTPTGPTLDEFLAEFNLTWIDVRSRYGATALDWRPFGGTDTVVELLEALRVQANSRIERAYQFRWEPVDLSGPFYADRERLVREPSLVIIDPISLYDPATANAFRSLDRYAQISHSSIISLAPLGLNGQDWLGRAMRAQAVPLMDEYFEPRIPPLSSFARCAINVQRIEEIERFVRSRLGLLHLRTKEDEAKDITGVVR